jgi:alternative ribosome-rescue factor|tara:strand:- start:120 stop:224 length:105 start_codon:yes stop_codon:yes gene_type:complete
LKKNLAAKNLADRRYKPKVVKPKKGKGSFKRKKN